MSLIKKSTITFIAPTIVFCSISYVLVFDKLDNIYIREIEKNKEAKEILSKNLIEIKNLNLENIQNKIYTNTLDIQDIQEDIQKIQNFNHSLASSLKSANFDKKSWLEMVDYLKDYSKINNITINKIKNFDLLNTKIKKQTINMQIIGFGEYKNIVNFINDIENFSTMVKIKDIQISKKDILEFSINLEGWEFNIEG